MSYLDVKDLKVSYGLSKVLHGVNLTLEKGELVSLVGRNGVGKSTTIRAIMGVTPPSSGSIVWQGQDIFAVSSYKNARRGMGYVPEERRIFADLTVRENLMVAALPARDTSRKFWDEEAVFEFFPDLKKFATRKGGLLSGGQQQMLTIGRTLMGNPDLILLDEPSEGLAPQIVADIATKIESLKASGISIILAEQNLDFVLSLSDRCYVLEKGHCVFTGTSDELRNNEEVQKKYLHI